MSNISDWNETWTSVEDAPTGIFKISSDEGNRITDLPMTFNSLIYLTSYKRGDQYIYQIHNARNKLFYVGYKYGSAASINWQQLVTNSDIDFVKMQSIKFEVEESTNRALIWFYTSTDTGYRIDFRGDSNKIIFTKVVNNQFTEIGNVSMSK